MAWRACWTGWSRAARNGFFGCHALSKTDELLRQEGKKSIDLAIG